VRKAEELIIQKIIKAAEHKKLASAVLPVIASTLKSKIINNAFQKLQRPEAITSAIAFTDQADEAMKMFKITNTLLKARQLEEEEELQEDQQAQQQTFQIPKQQTNYFAR